MTNPTSTIIEPCQSTVADTWRRVNPSDFRMHSSQENGDPEARSEAAPHRPPGEVPERAHASRRSAARAAHQPHMPCTPAPGGVEAEHRYAAASPVIGTR